MILASCGSLNGGGKRQRVNEFNNTQITQNSGIPGRHSKSASRREIQVKFYGNYYKAIVFITTVLCQGGAGIGEKYTRSILDVN